MTKDWQEPPESYEHTFSGLKTGSEILADLEAEAETNRERLERHGPVFCAGFPCAGCGAYLKVKVNVCPLCAADQRKAAA